MEKLTCHGFEGCFRDKYLALYVVPVDPHIQLRNSIIFKNIFYSKNFTGGCVN